MGKLQATWRRRMKLGRIMLSYPSDNNKPYKELDDDEKVVRLLNKAYELLSGGTAYNKSEFTKELEENRKYL